MEGEAAMALEASRGIRPSAPYARRLLSFTGMAAEELGLAGGQRDRGRGPGEPDGVEVGVEGGKVAEAASEHEPRPGHARRVW